MDKNIKSSVINLRQTILKTRQSLQRSLTFARIISKNYRPLRKVSTYRSNGICFYPEKILATIPFSMDRLSCPLVALHIPHHCPYCQTRHHDHNQLKDNDLYPSTSSIERFKSRQRQRRVATLAHDRATYHAELIHSQYNATHLIDRIKNATADMIRADARMIHAGAYNTEMEFLNKRQRADVTRDSHLFRTSSVHEFGQELTLEQAKPILAYEIERATALAEKNKTTLTFLTTKHPLVLHSCSRLVHWWAVRLRMKKGRLALRLLAAQLKASVCSEQELLNKWLRRRMATRIQNCYRCHRARLRLQRLKHERAQRMGKRILTFLRFLYIFLLLSL